MASGSKWLAVTVPLAAFLGSAAGVVLAPWATEQIRVRTGVVLTPAPAPVLAIKTTPVAEPASMPPTPSRVLPGAVLSSSSATGTPSPADEMPPVPKPGRSPFDSDSADDASVNLPKPAPAPAPGEPTMTVEPEAPEPPAGPPISYAESHAHHKTMLDWGIPIPPGFFDLPAPTKNDGTEPPILKPGQLVQVEVLESLPGRPITGVRVIRPDGTISLGFYGDLAVAGLNRHQVKVKLIAHLREFISDQALGLLLVNLDNRIVLVEPKDNNRVFIDESLNYEPQATPLPTTRSGAFDPGGDLREQVKALNARVEHLMGQEPKPK